MVQKKKKIVIIVSIIMVVALLAVGTFAWVIEITTTKVENFSIEVDSLLKIEVSLDGENWSTDDQVLTVPTGSLTDVSGDGYNFYTPVLSGGETIYGKDTSWIEAVPGQDYISYDMYFRTSSNIKVFLDQGSYITPLTNDRSLDSSSEMTVEKIIRKSVYGDFTTDYIAAATRVAFIGDDIANPGETKINKLWMPSANYELVINNGTYSVTEHDDPIIEDDWQTHTIIDEDGYYQESLDYYADEDTVVTELNASMSSANDDTEVLSIEEVAKDADEDGYKVGKITVVLWIDGNDNESHIALAGGQIDIQFVFSAIALGAAPTPIIDDDADTMTFVNVSSNGYEFSIDNGVTWYDVDSDKIDSDKTLKLDDMSYSTTSEDGTTTTSNLTNYDGDILIRSLNSESGLASSYARLAYTAYTES